MQDVHLCLLFVLGASPLEARGLPRITLSTASGTQQPPSAPESAEPNFNLDTPYHEEDAAKLEALLQATTRTSAVPKQVESLLNGPTEVDVVVSGGALRGYFMLGARHALEERKDLRVRRYSGTSAGAWTAMFMASGFSTSEWLRTYTLTQSIMRQAQEQGRASPALMEAYREVMWPWFRTVLPKDAHKRCSGRLFVTITTLDKLRPRKLVVSHFESNEDLFEACVASSCVPLITQRGWGATFRGQRGFDGLFTENIPAFSDKKRPQLIFDLGKVQYSLNTIVNPTDQCIEALAVSGALQTARFLEGRRGIDPKREVMSWRGWKGPAYPFNRHLRGLRAPNPFGEWWEWVWAQPGPQRVQGRFQGWLQGFGVPWANVAIGQAQEQDEES